jgi:hypothetical protein
LALHDEAKPLDRIIFGFRGGAEKASKVCVVFGDAPDLVLHSSGAT